MAQIVPYRPDQQRLSPVSGAMQRAPTEGFGQEIGAAMERGGRALNQFAIAEEQRLAALDEAAVNELADDYGERERELLMNPETGFLNAQSKNALVAAPSVEESLVSMRSDVMSRAQGERQQAMLGRLLNQRQANARDKISGHVVRETERYRDASEVSRVAQMGVDIAALEDGPERLGMQMGAEEILRQRGARKGWDADTTQRAIAEFRTGYHVSSVNRLLNSEDPTVAQSYLDQWGSQMDTDERTALTNKVREVVTEFEAETWAEGVDLKPTPNVVVGTATEPFTLQAPVSASPGSGFGPRRARIPGMSTNHRGVDYPIPAYTPVAAAGPGVVKFAGEQRGYGNIVIVDHGGGVETRYAHLGRIDVQVGQQLPAGARLALSGGAQGMAGAGTSTGAHLHFEVRRGGEAVDPTSVVGRQLAGGQTQTVAGLNPTTLEDAYDEADKAAGGDWRRRRVFREAAARRYGRERQFEADRERQASDAIAPFMPGGAQAAASYLDVPAAVRAQLSPTQDTAVRNAFEAAARGGVETDDAVLDSLLDANAFTPDAFASTDLTRYADLLSEGDMNRVQALQRTVRAGQGPAAQSTLEARATQAMRGADTTLDKVLESAQIDPNTVEGRRERSQLRLRVQSEINRLVMAGETPTDADVIGVALDQMRLVRVGEEQVRAYQAPAGQAETLVPGRVRRDIERRLRDDGEAVTPQNILRVYREGLRDGTYDPNDRSRALF